MNIRIFDVAGPVMIGPSSSHTAGAARLARVAARIVGRPFRHVSFGLHGSFAKTYRGHGTDLALIAGALGLREDDEHLRNAAKIARERNAPSTNTPTAEIAREAGLTYDFYEARLDDMHDNSVRMTFILEDGNTREIAGSSIGGGQILIRRIDGLDVELTAQSPTLIISQLDKKGVVSEVTKILADGDINIGVMKLSRAAKGRVALCVIETDSALSEDLVARVAARKNVLSVQALNPDEGE